MNLTRTATAVALAVAALLAPLVTAPAASATEDAVGCLDGSSPASFPGASTKKTITTTYGSIIELRYSTNTCAWGRLTSGAVGDYVWVDRAVGVSQGNSGDWVQLGITQLTSGTQVYTPGYNDNYRVMRACAEVVEFFQHKVYCTGWY
ncbi:DUF2690 domain-containing protein [Actinosynnema sp. NPDC020468]|uniref:DUF2690 domain-containing protein n=1 Tax=Actinosynnema sp. NPDC020468 TaxID=3154488 RepID=UPI0033D71570